MFLSGCPPNDCFDAETGEFLIGPTRYGLTCADLALAVFDLAGLRLARYETWPIGRPGDREWQLWVADQLEADGAAKGMWKQSVATPVRLSVSALKKWQGPPLCSLSLPLSRLLTSKPRRLCAASCGLEQVRCTFPWHDNVRVFRMCISRVASHAPS